MDSSGLGGGFNGGILDLESSLHRHQLSHLNVLGPVESDHRLVEVKGPASNAAVSVYGKGKGVSLADGSHCYNVSDEDEPSYMEDEGFDGVKGKKGVLWQRMKWTDNVVKLVIAVVACVGDDGVVVGSEGLKRKSGVLQKKGKWKMVSKIMISKGCHVSPQQCEDKFNDLNKRYKRLNDILGRGTSCRVVESPALMDTMPHLSTKAKDDVKKILSSKHLFYKEMCAYHNGQRILDCHDIDLQGYSLPTERSSKDNEGSDEEENPNTDDEVSNHDEGNNNNDFLGSPEDSFEGEMAGFFEDQTKSTWEKREWVKKQAIQLEGQKVNLQAQALELEKQRFRWMRYCRKKDRELEREKLENERMKLENERKVLHLRQKELEFDLRRSEASMEQ